MDQIYDQYAAAPDNRSRAHETSTSNGAHATARAEPTTRVSLISIIMLNNLNSLLK